MKVLVVFVLIAVVLVFAFFMTGRTPLCKNCHHRAASHPGPDARCIVLAEWTPSYRNAAGQKVSYRPVHCRCPGFEAEVKV